jgi:hypothetical protein
MNRMLVMLALAALCAAGCNTCGTGCGHGGCCPWLCGMDRNCGDSCGGDCCCEAGCGCESGYCEPGCGCSSNCGCEPGGCVDAACADCPVGQCRCGLFRRPCCPPYDDACGPYYGGQYDMSACHHGHGNWPCPCNCCETYDGCCGPCNQTGPGCGASGDHHYNFTPGPPTGQVAYPYYTVRGPRDFLMGNPPSIGPY